MKQLLLAALLCSACRASVSPVELANEQVHESVRQSFDASDGGAAPLEVRYNPAPCECPPYEVFAYGAWIRVFIDTPPPTVANLQTGDPMAVATVVGTVIDRPRASESGVLYRVFETK